MPYDLVLKGATVIEPLQNIRGVHDVAITAGKIAALAKEITEPSKECIPLEGKILTPGWVDIHTHMYAGATTWGIRGDAPCLATGVTTAVDAGSAGWAGFLGFRDYIVGPARTQILAFVHISGIGLTYGPLGEMEDLRYADPERTASVIRNFSDCCVGVKVRLGKRQVGANGVEPLRLAIQAAELSDRRVMVHIGLGTRLTEVLAELRPGDILTHCYRGNDGGILGENREVMPEVWKARERGVLFDVGHGGGSFRYEVAEKALAQGFPPDVISTDLHAHSLNGPVYSLPVTASKLLNLGVELPEVVRMTTSAPAAAIGRSEELGTLKAGTVADLGAFEILEGAFDFVDAGGRHDTGTQMIKPVLTVRAGQVYRPAELEEEVKEALRRAQEMKGLIDNR